MRSLLLATLLALAPVIVQAQAPRIPLENGRPAFATMGRETMPMMWIDEAALALDRFERIPFPAARWAEEKACLARLGARVDKVGAPPDIVVIPAVRTFRVHDMTIDSIIRADDSTWTGEFWDHPTIGYSLVRTGVILMAATYRANPYVLRHEALHFMLWRQYRKLAHPKEFFEPCDAHYDPKLGLKPNNDWR